MTINTRIQELRKRMSTHKIDAYIVPSEDYHQSEYVGDFFKCREYISGFTGSAGTVIITQTSAHIWTDGRYFIQAEKELANTEYQLHKQGLTGTVSIDDFLIETIPINGTLGFDGCVVSYKKGNHYHSLLSHKNVTIKYDCDLVGDIWSQRPTLPHEPIYSLEEKLVGESVSSKLLRLREKMLSLGVTAHLLSSLADIAWLFNLRGNDVAYTPVFLSYALITENETHLFLNQKKLTQNLKKTLQDIPISLHDYDHIYSYVQSLRSKDILLLDPSNCNYRLVECIPKELKCKHFDNPTTLFKSQKNKIEIENIKNAHLKDAIAHTKFIYWLKTNFNKIKITEQSASDKLEEYRKEQPDFLEPSFSPISAYGAHAAMCHYTCTPDSNVSIKGGSFYLIDSGGHYKDGSTDITRTIALGEITSDMKRHYTNVLRGNLALSKAKFLHGCSGENLDILARQFLWSSDLDYMHGTGHGIGNLLTIHEGPCSIRWKHTSEPITLEAGMILSNEPGLYLESQYGIRLENTLLVCTGIRNTYGQFMYFDTLTYVPFDVEAIDYSLMSSEEIEQLYQYHQKTYELLAPYLSEDERIWLKDFL